ncbi:MAG: YbjN domain-containing protein [Chloroflexi bacterium]|nr:YbjN domain-containing protein [Chloroflexota bacterium]
MPTDQTFEQLVAFLHEDNWRFRSEPEGGRIEANFRGRNGAYRIALGLDMENSTLLAMVADLEVIPRQFQHECLAALMALNYQFSLGSFEWDPNDGEVRFRIGLPLDDNDLTQAQFRRVLGVTCFTVDRYRPVLPKIIHGGRTASEAIQECDAEWEAANS